MDSILNWYTEEGIIFKGGSGAGVNLSRIRSSLELLKGGGTASGPVCFMRGADASAGTIKSGGKTRRAAKMVILDADHPDIEDFIWCKAIEERKARVLRDAGFDMDLDGSDSHSIQYQNANNSVRVTDEFMQAVIDGARLGTARPAPTARRSAPSRPVTSSARSPTRPGSAPTPACSSTRRSTAGTPLPTPDGSTEVTLLPRFGQGAHGQGPDPFPRALRPGQPGRDVRHLHARRHQPGRPAERMSSHLARSLHDHRATTTSCGCVSTTAWSCAAPRSTGSSRPTGATSKREDLTRRRGQGARPAGSGGRRRSGAAGVVRTRRTTGPKGDQDGSLRFPRSGRRSSPTTSAGSSVTAAPRARPGTIYGSAGGPGRDPPRPRRAAGVDQRRPPSSSPSRPTDGPAAAGSSALQALPGGSRGPVGEGSREVGALVDRAGAGRDRGRVPAGPLRRRRLCRGEPATGSYVGLGSTSPELLRGVQTLLTTFGV